MSISQPAIPIFKGECYEFWSFKMKTLFKSQDLWDLIENEFVDSDDENQLKDNRKKDSKAMFFIQQVVHETIFSRIVGATTSKQAWTILQNEFQGSTKVIVVKLQALRFEILLMKNNEIVQDFLSRVITITSQMKAYGEQITDETIVSKVLRSLPSKFDHVVATIKESKELSAFSFDELMGSLQSHELIKEEVECVVEAKVDNYYSIEITSNAIIVENSGCSNHMTGVRSMFKELDESYKIKVRLGDNKQIKVEGKGTVAVKEKKTRKIITVPMSGNNMFPLEVSDAGDYVFVADQRRCVYGKQRWQSFPIGRSWRASNYLELVHADLCGPMDTESFGGSRELTTPYTPEQNGVAEWKNRTIVEMARSLLKAKQLANDFWAEAIATVVYLQNISPTKAVLNYGSVQKHKARLVVKGYAQQQCIDFDDTFSPIARFETELYVMQPEGFIIQWKEDKVYRLRKALYGLKQAPRAWYKIKQGEDGVFICQKKYAEDLLKRFNMQNFKIAITPMNVNEKLQLEDGTEETDARAFRSLIGGLMYLSHTRPDIVFSVGMVSRFMQSPTKQHFGAAKRILRYIAGTTNYGIWFTHVHNFKLVGFIDSDWTGSLDDRKSNSGYVFSMGSGAITWSSKKQGVTELSTSEVEYVAATSSACQATWLRRLLVDMN
ncbi:phytosulfokine receptor 1-like [Hibiscus syriacus]|uniref:Phytosulfokine receptor 1-like n=1 Tax=Hibiscus syriacus TaxID=106335 RepID=A0A6A3CSV7_HIBSY|nr:phytosulfokine receptor 1-like [Hibiscus syriacus]